METVVLPPAGTSPSTSAGVKLWAAWLLAVSSGMTQVAVLPV